MIKEKAELEVSINIGKKKYTLLVEKNSDLSECVRNFLEEN